MELTRKQEEGLRIAVSRYQHHEKYTCIAGYAGTGKSTLVSYIIDALNIDRDLVAYIAFTGKASLVLKEKGCKNATTAHQLLYRSFRKKDGTFAHIPKRPLDQQYELIVVDEISMLPEELWRLLLSHNIHVIALGDPGQLPPIGNDNGVLNSPHVFLDEVMRQASENEIIRLSLNVREGKILTPHNGKEVMVIDRKDFDPGMYFWADQIIAGKNATRREINQTMREAIFNTTDNTPLDGDKIICLKNDWEIANGADDCLVNGMIGHIYNPTVERRDPFISDLVKGTFLPEYYSEDEFKANPLLGFDHLRMDGKIFHYGEKSVNANNWRKIPKGAMPAEFDYGYCITCHKSQGSEYNKILVFEEVLRREEHPRWLYTAITRAKDKLIIVKN